MRLAARLNKVEAKLDVCPGCGRRAVAPEVVVRYVTDGEPDPEPDPQPPGCDHRLVIVVRYGRHDAGHLRGHGKRAVEPG
jgi:hypothetical protein